MTTAEAGEPGPVKPGRFRLTSPVTATVLGVLTVILTAAGIMLSILDHQGSILGSSGIVPIALVYAAVGIIVARRQPGNPIGWILITFIPLFLLSGVVGFYASLYYRFGHHGLPLAQVAVLLQPLWAPALLMFPVVILLFPDGRLASRRWRWPPPPWPRRRCSTRCGGGCSTRWTGGSTRARYDADEAVAVFAGRLQDAVDLDSVQDDLTGVIQQTLEPAHLALWVSRRG